MKIKFLSTSFLLFISTMQVFSQTAENPDTVCAGSNVYYQIANATVSSGFTWGIYNSEGTISFGAGTDSIRVDWDNTAGTDSLWVFETNTADCQGDTAKITIVRMMSPTAEFDNDKLCFGETLHINFTGTWPYQVEYTQNGTTVTQIGITDNPYTVGQTPGNYVLIQVSNKHCGSITPNGTLNAIIGNELQQLQIFHE